MIVGVDLDGVTYNFGESLRRYLATVEHTFDLTKDPDNWHFYEDWGMSVDVYKKVFADGLEAGIVFSGPIMDPDAPKQFQRLRDHGHAVHIVTHRDGPLAEAATIAWLAEHGINYDFLTFSSDKTVADADFFIEDNMDNYDKLDAAGTEVYLINRPWNVDPTKERRRVDSIEEFVDGILFARLFG